ncbi:class I SAM-dependent methyltransferase [Mesorhizobium opportunistum]|nr:MULTISPECIES: class I SAM-dependent methyltransferase [Mesorhizobium]WJI40013.1 class I SAM-dependent methyltransferase [Mesorhizobium opportunistum]
MRRRNTHFYQGTSDEFFSDLTAVNRVVPEGIDLAFLDGLHLVEVLLRDFINAEQLANKRSMFVLHDCLPLNERMAQRTRYAGDDSEPKEIGGFWTGDVWKIVPLLTKYRPELHVSYIDCPPTGLVVCTGLDRVNRVLAENYDRMVGEAEELRPLSVWISYGVYFRCAKAIKSSRPRVYLIKHVSARSMVVTHSGWRNLMRS